MFKFDEFKTVCKFWGSKVLFATLISFICVTSYVTELFSAMPTPAQDAALHPVVMMSDGKESKVVPMEEFLKVALEDAGKMKNKEEFQNVLNLKRSLDRGVLPSRPDGLAELSDQRSANGLPSTGSVGNWIRSAFKDSFVVDTLKESLQGVGQSLKSLSKSVIKGVAVGATMGVVLLIGGAIVWQLLIIPAYCNGPGPLIADWIPGISERWGSGKNGICNAQLNKISAQEAQLKQAAKLISNSVPAVVLPDGSFAGYCEIDGTLCDPSLCAIDKNLRGC